MPNLKPCPFCGSAAEHVAESSVLLAECSNMKCTMHDWAWDIATWNTRPIEDALRAEIAELKKDKPILCAECNDHILPDDEAICGVCADTKNSIIDELMAENEALKSQAIVWHKYPDEKPDMGVKCLVMFDDGELEVTTHTGLLWYDIEKNWLDRITHWAYLPAPPEED